MPKYKVHVYREMRLVFDDIEAATPEKAAETAGEKHFDNCDEWSDCEGQNLYALVDHAPHEGTVIEFEAGRMLDAGPVMLKALHRAKATIEALQSDIDRFRLEAIGPARYDVGEAEYNTRETVIAIDEAIAKVAGVSMPPAPARTITVHIEGGLVQDVTGIQAGVEVRVEDRDKDGDTSHPSWDEERQCFVTVYGGEGV
jgi:hypothetical protein